VPDYDAADSAPLSEQVASAYEDVAEDAPWKDIDCICRPAAMHAMGPTKFVRSLPLSANQDIKTYDAGNFFLCTLDGTAVPWGKLWVEYDVTLMTPQLPSGGGGLLASQHIDAAAPTTAAFLGGAVVAAGSTELVRVAGNVLTFTKAGKYLLSYIVGVVTSATQTVAPVISADGSFETYLTIPGPAAVGSSTPTMNIAAVVNAVIGTTVTFNNTLVGAGAADLWVSQLALNQA